MSPALIAALFIALAGSTIYFAYLARTYLERYETAFNAALRIIEFHEEWQPINTAPKDGTVIDLWAGDYRYTNAYWFDHIKRNGGWNGNLSGWVFEGEGTEYVYEDPTYWRRIPRSPEEERGEA